LPRITPARTRALITSASTLIGIGLLILIEGGAFGI
jgi:hypothetical protein